MLRGLRVGRRPGRVFSRGRGVSFKTEAGKQGALERFSRVDTVGEVPYHLRRAIKVKGEGVGIITNPLFNKGSAFRHGERDRLGIRGLLPSRQLTMDEQVDRACLQLEQEETPMRKNIYLRDLQDRNETLFHRVLIDNIRELAPIVYTPTVGLACQQFGTSFRRPRGMYFNAYDAGDMGAMVYNWSQEDVHVIVVTDGGRILGLGDLGVNGMGIPIGKLNLYCAAGGIAPHRVMPVMIDAGTNNKELLADPFYLGSKHTRIDDEEYYELLDEFMFAIFQRFPNAFLQFEDFGSDHAMTVLERYKNRFCCFNDDIQGTGAVAVAGVLSALNAIGEDASTALKKKRIMIAGAGSAGIGVATALASAMAQQGIPLEEARKMFYVCDVDGVLSAERMSELTPEQQAFARDDDAAGLTLQECIDSVKPNILLGLTACPGLFTEEVITAMADNNERPIIFPLSNPTSKCEASAEQVYRWTEGRAIFASGSPFDPVELNGKTYTPSQCNNMFIFPGLGLGATLCKPKSITEGMIYATSLSVVDSLNNEEKESGVIFPDIERIREVSAVVAVATIRAAVREGVCKQSTSVAAAAIVDDDEAIMAFVKRKMYDPVYVPLVDEVYKGARK